MTPDDGFPAGFGLVGEEALFNAGGLGLDAVGRLGGVVGLLTGAFAVLLGGDIDGFGFLRFVFWEATAGGMGEASRLGLGGLKGVFGFLEEI